MLLLVKTTLQAQAPTISSFTPISGAPGTVVTLTGTNFNTTAANNIVKIGATKATVSAATATSLTVTVPAGATYEPVSILNTATALMGASLKFFLPTFSPSKAELTINDFLPKVDFATTGNQSYYVSLGDLDGDGKPDLAVANYASGTVSVYRNTSISGTIDNASFAAKVDFTTGSNPIAVAIGDLNGDGKPELAVTNNGSATVSVFRNTASIGAITTASFAAKVDFTTGTNPRSIAIGDLDGDGRADLAIANTTTSNVSILLHKTSTTAIEFFNKVDFTTGSAPHFVAIGDLDGDGKPDLATANNGSASVSVLRNISTSGTISFGTNVDFTAGTSPVSVAIGDLNADGKPELAVANFSSANVSVFQNNAISGTPGISFATKVDFTAGAGAWSVAIGDLDGDGKPDLAVANAGVASVSVLRNICDLSIISGSSAPIITASSFAPKVDFATATATRSVAIADVDLDGKPDIVAANYSTASISVLRNDPICSLTYDGNTNTSGTVPAISYTSIGTSATLSTNTGNLTKTNYTFAGWNTLANGSGTFYAASGSATFTINNNDTLYAKWTLNNFTVTFNANGGTGTMTPQTIAYTTSANLTSNAFTRAGYSFAGWATSSGGTVAYANGASYTMSTATDVILYAKWISTTLAYWVNNTGATRPATVTVNAEDYNTFTTPYTNIQSAINVATANINGGLVYITNGTYVNPSSLVTPNTNCNLNASFDANLSLNFNAQNRAIKLTSETGDFRTSSAKLVGYGLNINDNNGTVTIQGLQLDNVHVNGMYFQAPVGNYGLTTIRNNKITNTRGHGIKSDSPADRGAWVIEGNCFQNIGYFDALGNCPTPAPVSAIWLGEPGNLTITNNTIKRTKWVGILLDGFSYQNNYASGTETTVISGNYVSETQDAGIQIGFSSGRFFYPSGVSINNNILKSCNKSLNVGRGAITLLQSNLNGVSIQNNDISLSYNGIAICIAGWQNSTTNKAINFNNIYKLIGGYGVTHIANIAPNGLFGTGDDLSFYNFDNNYWGAADGPLNAGGAGQELKKDAVNTTYSLGSFDYTPFATSANTVTNTTCATCLTVNWYQDADADGYGDVGSTTSTSCTWPTGYVDNSVDCNDANPSMNAQFGFYADTDADGFGVAPLISVCAVNASTAPTGYSSSLSYTLFFDGNGADQGTMSPQTIYSGSDILNPNGYSLTGYSFVRWNTKIDGSGTSYIYGTSYALPAANDTLYAQWTLGTVPVNFISITASRKTTAALVNWKVGNEINIHHYEVERSVDSRNYSRVGNVAATGVTDYSFLDVNAPTTNLFYRVKSVENAGEGKYSAVVKLTAEKTTPGYAVAPNPIVGSEINVQFKNQSAGKYQFKLFNNAGQQIQSNNLNHAGGNGTQTIQIPAGLARGAYQLEIISADKTSSTVSIFINNL